MGRYINVAYLLIYSVFVACGDNKRKVEQEPIFNEIKAESLGCFVAKIGNQEVLFELSAIQDSLFGRYCYTKYKRDLMLNGFIDKEGNYVLFESFANNITGKWEFQSGFIEGQWLAANSQAKQKIIIVERLIGEESDNLYDEYLKKLLNQESTQLTKFKNVWTKSEYCSFVKINDEVVILEGGKLKIMDVPRNGYLRVLLSSFSETCAREEEFLFKVSKDLNTASNKKFVISVSDEKYLDLRIIDDWHRCSFGGNYIKID